MLDTLDTLNTRSHSAGRRMDEQDAAEAATSLEPGAVAADPTQTNVEAQKSSREQVTGAVSGPGPLLEEPPPTAPPPAEATPALASAHADAPAATSPAAAFQSNTVAPVAPSRQSAHRVPQFVAPSSYLRFKTSHGSAMAAASEQPASKPSPSPPSPLDKEQRQGLVRHRVRLMLLLLAFAYIWPGAGLWHPVQSGLRALSQRGTRANCTLTECDPRISQSSHELRCLATLLSANCVGYRSPY